MITPHHPEDEDFAVALVYHPDGLHQPAMDLYFPLAHLHRPEFREMGEMETGSGIIHVGGDGHVDCVDLLAPEDRPLWRRISMAELALRFHFSRSYTPQVEADDVYSALDWAVSSAAWAARGLYR